MRLGVEYDAPVVEKKGAVHAARPKQAPPAAKGPTKKPRDPRPFYKRGIFWFAVIVLEATLAVLASFAFETDPYEVDLAGADLPVFCERVRAVVLTPSSASVDLNDSAGYFAQQVDALHRVAEASPPDLRADVDRITELTSRLLDTARSIEEKKRADPSYNGIDEMSAALAGLSTEGDRASRRFVNAVREGCGLDLETPVTAPPATAPGTAPGTTPAPAPSGTEVGTTSTTM